MDAIRQVNAIRTRLNRDLDVVVGVALDDLDYENFAYENVLHAIAKPETMAEKALRSLAEFYDEHTEDDLIPDDLEEIENWGLTVRDDQEVLVVIDAGFSDQIWRDFYAK